MKLNGKRSIIMALAISAVLGFVAEAQTYQRPRRQQPQYQTRYQNQRPNRQEPYRQDSRNDYGYEPFCRYKGFLEVGFSPRQLCNVHVHELNILTTHGVSLGDCFFAGVGSGVVLLLPTNNHFSGIQSAATLVPLYADFRINGKSHTTAFFDFKAGGAFLTKETLTMDGTTYNNDQAFAYLSPTVGVRIATSRRGAVNIGLSYSWLSQRYYNYDYWGDSYYYDGLTISNLGFSLSVEW